MPFAHGSGSSRHSSRNQYVAGVLEQQGFATLLIDLLTEEEEAIDRRTAHLRFDIEMLAAAAMAQMPGDVRLDIVPGATHLFEDPGTLERVAILAAGWFSRYLEPAYAMAPAQLGT